MEVSHRNLSTGEQSGGQEHLHEPQYESCHNNPKPTTAQSQQQHGPSNPRQTKRLRHERKRLRVQKRNVKEAETLEKEKSEWTSRSSEDMDVSDKCPETSTSSLSVQPSMETHERTAKQKRERKPQKPGKYVCTYCGRACAKPSVLQKHIRSHTGERPYPCAPCGFSFKTKSNLYKHRKSHTHKVKAGMASGRHGPDIGCHEEPVTESDEDAGQLSTSSKTQEIHSQRNLSTEISPKGQSQGLEYSHAVKKRLAMRLSKGRRAPLGSSDETLSIGQGSKGSTESGYFSRSESTEVCQESLPNTSAKSYAEVILGKFGRLGHLHRTVRQQDEHSTEQEGRSIPFSVPKKHVIDHITKLITINEAVVDTSKLDSVKPRRFSFSKKSSIESPSKDAILCRSKELDFSSKSRGSITLGVPCEKFQQHSTSTNQPANPLTTGPLLRSHSLPSDASIETTTALRNFGYSQSFDEQPAQNRRHGMLRRQPAIELPIGAENTAEEQSSSSSPFHSSVSMVSDCKQKQLEAFVCEACGLACNNWEKYKTHKNHCPGQPSHQLEIPTCQAEEHGTIYKARVGGLTVRKRRKEESLELDDSSLPSAALPSTFTTSQGYIATCLKPTIESAVSNQAHEKENTLKGVSVIQHTSLFNKQEPLTHTYLKEQTSKPNFRKLVRQHNIQIPEIRVTEETNIDMALHPQVSETKETKKVGDFQWPQRSPSLAQLPIEKLPPKKKRLRLAEATQSSGDSSFESQSLPHSPSQDTHRFSHSTSVEESVKSDFDTMPRRSRDTHTLTISSTHHPHREMQRSASEQAPHIPQQTNPIVETRSKSFDYSCLSPERTPAGWKERRKCLLIKHSAVREPEEELSPPKPVLSVNPLSPSANISPRHSPDTFPSSVPSLSHNVSLSNTVCPSLSHKADTYLPAVTQTDVHTVIDNLHCLSGAARAHYYSVSSGLKLEIPTEESVGQSAANYPHYHTRFDITPSQELLRPPGMQRVPVRLYSDLPTHANLVYTTLSQTVVAVSQNPSCSGLRLESIGSRFDFKDQPPVAEGSKSSSTGGNKRVLSPTTSVELTLESQLQKRVKEEEEKNTDNAQSNTSSIISGKKEDSQLCIKNIIVPIKKEENLYTSLDTNPAVSWCYLNYVKPNPAAQDNQNSVYSTWCISTRNPNPPGLTSKDVLSLVHCKQRNTSFTYTTAAMAPSTVEKPAASDTRDGKKAEVHAIQPKDPTENQKPVLRRTEKSPREEGEEEAQSTAKYNEILRVQICEGGYRSSEEYVYVRGRGRGRYVCEECGIRCKKPSMLRKHIKLHTDARPYICQHCNFAFKTKGNLTKHMKSKAHGKRCPEGTTPGPVLSEPDTEDGGGTEESFVTPEVTEEHQFSDADDTDEEEDDTEEADKETLQSSASSANTSVCSEGSRCQSALNPNDSVKTKASRQLSSNTSLYADTTTAMDLSSPICSFSPGLHLFAGHSCSPQQDVSLLHCLSPRLSLSSSPCHSSLSLSTRSASPFSLRHLSPVRDISPICPMSPSSPQSCSFGASVTVQQRACKHQALTKPSTNTVNSKSKLEKMSTAQRSEHQDELLFFRHGEATECQRVLSHLPLHSQPQSPSSTLSLMIPIGGIQMVQISTIGSGLPMNWSNLNHSMTQADVAELVQEEKNSSSSKLIRYGSAQGGQIQETKEPNAKKRDAPNAPLTTWKSISQRKGKKRLGIKSAHVLKSATIEHTTQTSTDSDTTPKSTWKEKASRVSERNKSERRL